MIHTLSVPLFCMAFHRFMFYYTQKQVTLATLISITTKHLNYIFKMYIEAKVSVGFELWGLLCWISEGPPKKLRNIILWWKKVIFCHMVNFPGCSAHFLSPKDPKTEKWRYLEKFWSYRVGWPLILCGICMFLLVFHTFYAPQINRIG